MKKLSLILISILLLGSCGQSPDEEAYDALISAENFLTSGLCDKAMEKVDSIPERPNDLFYIKIKASAFACKGGYTTTDFFVELTDLNFGTGTDLLSAFTTFNMAQDYTDGPGDREYEAIYDAIDTLLFSGDTGSDDNPSAANIIYDFGADGGSDINTYLLYLSMVQLGKYLFYYGNTDSDGTKGAGGNASTSLCLADYSSHSDGATVTAIDALLGAGNSGLCTDSSDQAHPDLSTVSTALFVERACEGVVLFNVFTDMFANIELGDIASGFSAYADDISAVYTAATALTNDDSIITIRNRQECEANFATNSDDLLAYMAGIFEILHSR